MVSSSTLVLGRRMRTLRRNRGLTQEELAKPEYTAAYISTIEAGKRQPSPDAIRYFAAKLNVHPDELATGRPASLLPELDLQLQQARLALSAGRVEDSEAQFKDVEKRARHFGLPHQEAKAIEGLGLVRERRGQTQEAVDLYRTAEKLLDGEPLHLRADAIAGKARCYHLAGEKTHAIYLLETYLHALEQEGLADPDALIRVYTSLVITYVESGYLKQASEFADKALALEQRVVDPARLGAMHNMVASALLERGDTRRAEQSLDKAERFYRISELELELGRARLAKGIFLSRSAKNKAARQSLSAALETFESLRSPLDEARACTELAGVERAAGKTDNAIRLLERSVRLIGTEDIGELARTKRELGLTLASVDKAKAQKNLREAIDLFVTAEERVEATITHGHLGDLLSRKSLQERCDVYRAGIELLEAKV